MCRRMAETSPSSRLAIFVKFCSKSSYFMADLEVAQVAEDISAPELSKMLADLTSFSLCFSCYSS